MFVEGTLRWQVTEDCPWDLLVALAVRELAGLDGMVEPVLPRLEPAVVPALQSGGRTDAADIRGVPSPVPRTRPAPSIHPARPAGRPSAPASDADTPRGDDAVGLVRQWEAWFEVVADRHRRLTAPPLHPPHFEAFDRVIELQDAVIAHYAAAAGWATVRHAEYVAASVEHHARRAADIVDVVREREHELRRQAGYFRLDIDVLPVAEKGTWIVGPHTVVVSASLRDDSVAFRDWLRPLVAALV